MLPGVIKPCWLVCEDGSEYLDRFTRFLAGDFDFVHATSAQALIDRITGQTPGQTSGPICGQGPRPFAGVILDLDFRRTPREQLVDEDGRDGAALSDEQRRRLSESQGILILRLLRARGIALPVILYADLDDAGQAAYLEQAHAPLAIVPSHEGLRETAARMKAAPW